MSWDEQDKKLKTGTISSRTFYIAMMALIIFVILFGSVIWFSTPAEAWNTRHEVKCGTKSLIVDTDKITYIYLDTKTNIKNTAQLIIQITDSVPVNVLCDPEDAKVEYEKIKKIITGEVISR
ncbi:MAG: hypothetical protein KAS32_05805 [Candidatus Peribacteraceae bacterium]|nr:hypothetical protein [Candidatus Peribacteraceae bacterium]